MKRAHYSILGGVVFLVLSAILKFGIAPFSERLPVDYSREFVFNTESHFRESPEGDLKVQQIVAKRIDQTLSASGEVSIIQSDTRWVSSTGAIVFEGSGIYGVNRQTYENTVGYGNSPRSGQFLFPPHVRPATYDYWDSIFIGKRSATFSHEETQDGLRLFVFDFSGLGIDETAGYAYLADVPEKYQTNTDGRGKLWIEPLSGTIVDYQDIGVSYFVDPVSTARVAILHEWNSRYTPEFKTGQIALARASMQRILLLDVWLPAGFLILGLACFCYGFWSSQRMRKVNIRGKA